MATTAEVVAQMRSALAISDPEMDTSIGTPARKVLDAVGESIAMAYVDGHLLDYQYDIDAKTGDDLTQFVELFGFTRFTPKRATGVVTFSRPVANTEVLIPIGSQVGSNTTPTIVFGTVMAARIAPNETTVDVPVMAIEGGTAGNLPAGSLSLRGTAGLVGVSLTNVDGTAGGTDMETDDELRARFRRTVFRSIAGTQSMYEGTALEDIDVSQVNVVGATKRFREQVQISGGLGISQVQDARYIYPNTPVVGPDIDAGIIYSQGVHYSFDTTTNATVPRVVILNSTAVPDGTILDLSFDYVPIMSRNQPDANPPITNRIDIFVNGVRAVAASETLVMRRSVVLNNTPTSKFYVGNFVRDKGGAPSVGWYFIPLAFGPIVTVPDVLTINALTYTKDGSGTGIKPFYLVYDKTSFGNSFNSLAGLAFPADANAPADNVIFTIAYSYNDVPRSVEESVRNWRILGTDVRVHQATFFLLKFNLAVMYVPHSNKDVVDQDIATALQALINGIGFNSVVQVSDVLQVVHNVSGVDNVRFLTSTDSPTSYAIQQMSPEGNVVTTFQSAGRATDIKFGDAELPVFSALSTVAKAQNTFGTY